MDVSIYTGNSETSRRRRPTGCASRRTSTGDMFALFRRYAAEITSVTLWGLADDNTWLDTFPVTRKDAPLLFDTRLQAKTAYWGWWIRAGSPIDRSPSPADDVVEWSSPAGAGCAVTYRVTGSWHGRVPGRVPGSPTPAATAVSGWSLAWQCAGGQAHHPAVERLGDPGRHGGDGDQRGLERRAWPAAARRRSASSAVGPAATRRRRPSASTAPPARCSEGFGTHRGCRTATAWRIMRRASGSAQIGVGGNVSRTHGAAATAHLVDGAWTCRPCEIISSVRWYGSRLLFRFASGIV